MDVHHKGLCWAAAICAVAVGEHQGLIDTSSAQTMLAVLPAVAVATMFRGRCRRRQEA